MRHTPSAVVLILAALLAALVPLSPAGREGESEGGKRGEGADGGRTKSGSEGAATQPTGPTYRMVEGKVAKVDLGKARLAIEDGGKSVEVSFDRNTSVFLERHVGTRLGTVRDVVPSAEVRASVDKDGLASWIEVHALPREAAASGGDAGPPSGPVPAQPGSPTTATPR